MPTIAPVARLKKSEIVWLSSHRCKHSHTYLSHFSCYLSEMPEGSPLVHNIGFFDIETSGFKASSGFLFGYAIKDLNSDKIYESWLEPQDRKKNAIPDQKRIVKNMVNDLKQFDLIVTYYGCVAPGNKVLRSNLEWDNVENLKSGDKLIAFNEHGPRRNWEISEVVCNIPIEKECVRLYLSNGEEIDCSIDHPWLCNENYYWMRPIDMNKMTRGEDSFTKMRQLMPVWETDNSYEAGYLAASFDGEGTIKKDNPSVMMCQKKNGMLNSVVNYLDEKKYNYYIGKRESDVYHIGINGGLQDTLKFLGSIKPKRLYDNLNIDALNNNNMKSSMDFVRIIKIENIGKKVVMGMETTSKTYIVNGFGSHNTKMDMPFARTKALMNGIKFPEYGELIHFDLYYLIRNKFSLHSNSLQVACETLLGSSDKTRFSVELWNRALFGDQDCMDLIADHCRKDVCDTQKLYELAVPFRKRIDRSV